MAGGNDPLFVIILILLRASEILCWLHWVRVALLIRPPLTPRNRRRQLPVTNKHDHIIRILVAAIFPCVVGVFSRSLLLFVVLLRCSIFVLSVGFVFIGVQLQQARLSLLYVLQIGGTPFESIYTVSCASRLSVITIVV